MMKRFLPQISLALILALFAWLSFSHHGLAVLGVVFLFCWVSQMLMFTKVGPRADFFLVVPLLLSALFAAVAPWWQLLLLSMGGHLFGVFWTRRRLGQLRRAMAQAGVHS